MFECLLSINSDLSIADEEARGREREGRKYIGVE
jgi:hypothetical protein